MTCMGRERSPANFISIKAFFSRAHIHKFSGTLRAHFLSLKSRAPLIDAVGQRLGISIRRFFSLVPDFLSGSNAINVFA